VGEQTRFAFLSGVHIPAQRLAGPALAAVGRSVGPAVLDRLEAQVRARAHR
jgi:hypothetical protein